MSHLEMFEIASNGTAYVMPYAWPGGYPIVYVTDDGGCLCPNCVQDNLEEIGTTHKGSGWNVVGMDANWEDPSLFCDHCGNRIKSAYAEDEAAV